MAERSWYEPRKDHDPADTPGFDAELLRDLHDCIRSFGAPTDKKHAFRRISYDDAGTVPLYAFGNVTPADRIMIYLSRMQYGVAVNKARTIPLSAPQSSGVMIGDGITAEEVRGLIAHVDARMREAGLFREDGTRMTMTYENIAGYEVAKVFPEPGEMVIVGEGVHPAEIHQRFDKPDEVIPIVVVREKPNPSYMAFIWINDPSMRSRVDATMHVAKEWGFSHPTEILKYDMDGMARFFADVHDRLIAVGN